MTWQGWKSGCKKKLADFMGLDPSTYDSDYAKPRTVFTINKANHAKALIAELKNDGLEGKAQSLVNALVTQIDGMDKYKRKHRRIYVLLQWLTILASFFATVSIGIAGLVKEEQFFLFFFWLTGAQWNALAIVSSALVTTLALLARLHSHRDLWLVNTSYLHDICKIFLDLNAHLRAGELDEEKLKALRDRLHTLEHDFSHAMHGVYAKNAADVDNNSESDPTKE